MNTERSEYRLKDFYRIVLHDNSTDNKESVWNCFSETGVLICLSGLCFFETFDARVQLNESQIVIIGKNESYKISNHNDNSHICMSILFNNSINTLPKLIETDITRQFCRDVIKTSIINTISESTEMIGLIARKIYPEYMSRNISTNMYFLSLGYLVLVETMNIYRTGNPFLSNDQEAKIYDRSRIVKRAIQYINTHYSSDISLKIIADNLYVSSSYLSRYFKVKVGMSIVQFITSKRIFSAKNLLIATDMNISEVAMDVGFQNIPYFNAVFKKSTGFNPSQFRDKFKIGL